VRQAFSHKDEFKEMVRQAFSHKDELKMAIHPNFSHKDKLKIAVAMSSALLKVLCAFGRPKRA
jgi:hypothetical protein